MLCTICGKKKTFYRSPTICQDCLEKYTNEDGSRPEWLRFMINDNQRLQRQARRTKEHEVTVGLIIEDH